MKMILEMEFYIDGNVKQFQFDVNEDVDGMLEYFDGMAEAYIDSVVDSHKNANLNRFYFVVEDKKIDLTEVQMCQMAYVNGKKINTLKDMLTNDLVAIA
jgi:hypothetical protein